MMNELFQLEHFSRDSFRVKRTYVDAAGDLVAGILLGQIVYWHLPNEEGKSKLRVVKDGKKWLAKGRNDWWDEIRITPKQFDRAIKILEEKNFVETKKFKFSGAPTIHLRLKTLELTQTVKSILTFGENETSLKGEMELDLSVNSLTENTAKTTSKITTDKDNVAGAPSLPYADIVNYLNEKCETRYKTSSKKTKELIKARINEGFSLDDFKTVIDKKVADANDPNTFFSAQYLRPETLFGSKFEAYLNQKGAVKNARATEADELTSKYNFGF